MVGALVACGGLSSLADSAVALCSVFALPGDNLLHEVLMQYGRVFDNHADAPEVGGPCGVVPWLRWSRLRGCVLRPLR
jgi:hypothetical protein